MPYTALKSTPRRSTTRHATSSGMQCWGAGDDGQLGSGSFVANSAPIGVTGVAMPTQIAAGGDHS